MPYLSASVGMIREAALYQAYIPLPSFLPFETVGWIRKIFSPEISKDSSLGDFRDRSDLQKNRLVKQTESNSSSSINSI